MVSAMCGESGDTRSRSAWPAPQLRGERVDHSAPHGVPGLVRARRIETPDAPATEDESHRLSYAELDARSDRLADGILAATGGATGAVALILPRGVDLLVALLGVLKAGCWYVPVATDEPPQRAAVMAELAEPVAVVAPPGRDLGPFSVAPLVPVPAWADPAGPLRDLPEVAPDQRVYIMFTSGSTGTPKGVVAANAALCNRILWGVRHYDLTPADRVLQKTPYTFDVSGWELYWPLAVGACCVFAPPDSHRDPARIAQLIVEQKITVCHFVSSMLDEFLRLGRPSRDTSLRMVFTSGEALPPALAAQFAATLDAGLHNLYGPTEGTIEVTQWAIPPDMRPDATVYIGAPIDNVDLYILDPDGRPVPDGEPGELWIGGVHVALGYVKQPELTARVFDATPYGRRYRTGDLVRAVDGQVEYLGRIDDQVKIRGVRIEPGEVERVLTLHPAITHAAVVAVPARGGAGDELVAAVTPAPGAGRVPAAEVRDFVARRLPAAFVPSGLCWLERLPLSSAGKADRRALRDELRRWWHGAEPSPAAAGAGADVRGGSDDVSRLWWGLLGTPGTERDEAAGFLNLGGHSLLAGRLVAELRAGLGVDVPLAALLGENASLAVLRGLVESLEVRRPAGAATVGHVEPVGHGARGTSRLAPGQHALWVRSQLLADPGGYNVVGAVRLGGVVDPAAMRAALADVVARHDALRAGVPGYSGTPGSVGSDGGPLLVFADACDAVLEVRTAAGPLDAAAVDGFVASLARRTIPLDRAPLLTAGLLLPPDGGPGGCLVLALHHIVSDQQTLDLVLAGLAGAYSARLRGSAPRWGPAPSFAAYAEAQAGAAGGPDWTADLAYWRGLLADVPPVTLLPFHLADPAVPSTAGERVAVVLDTGTSARVDAFGRERAVTPATLFVACVAVVLSAWSAQSTVVVGTPASRRYAELERDLVGFLLATLPLRVDVGAQPDVAALLGHVRERYAGALEHSTATFEAIVEALGVPASPVRNPLFQVWVNDMTQAAPAPAFGGVPASHLDVVPPAALFDLNFYLHRPDGYRVELVYATGRYPAGVARELLEQVVRVLRQVVTTRGSAPLSRLRLAGEGDVPAAGDAGVLVPTAATTPAAAPRMLDAVRATAARVPHSVAVSDAAGGVSYADLVGEVDRLAAGAAGAGATGGDLVLVHAERSRWLPVALLGLWAAGATAVLVDAALPALVRRGYEETVRPRWTLRLPGADGGFHLAPGGGLHLAPGGLQLARSAAAEPLRLPGASHALFTSGTTGRPAAVAVPPSALAGTLGWYLETFAPSGRDRVALLAGLGHDPVLRDMLVPLMAGGTLVVPPDDVFASPERLFTFVREARVTILHATPALLGLLVAGGLVAGGPHHPVQPADGQVQPAAGLADLRLVLCGGAPLTARLVRALRRLTPARVVNAYGTTETPQVASCQVVAEAGEPLPAGVPDQAVLPVGAGVGGAELVVVDATGALAGIGQLGEVVVRSPHLALGYAGDSGDAGRFVPDPAGRPGYRAYHTGDLGRRDPWGGVHLDGRLDRQVLVDGFRVAPEQVEAAALGLPHVADALVTLRSTPAGEVLVLQVVAAAAGGLSSGQGSSRQPPPGGLSPDQLPPDQLPPDQLLPGRLSADEVRARLRGVLPPYAVPADIRVVPRLGTDHNHKVAAAPDDAVPPAPGVPAPPDGYDRPGGYDRPDGAGTPGAVVAELSRLVREVTGRDLPPHENFLDGGLSSVGLVRLHALLSQRLAVELPVTALFQHPNLAALARYLAHRGAGDGARDPEPAPTGNRETVSAGSRQAAMVGSREAVPAGARDAGAAGPDPAQQRRQLRERLYRELGEVP